MPHTTPALTAILQASALEILGLTIQHFSLEHGFAPIQEFSDAYKANRSVSYTEDGHVNMTDMFNNLSTDEESLTDKSFFVSELPKRIPVFILTAFIRYWWLIWLERLLPARPRARRGTSASIPTSTALLENKEDDDSREEEIIRKWVEAGKIRRASLSWCNTFLKWLMDLTLGSLWYTLLYEFVMEPAMQWTSPWNVVSKSSIGINLVGNLLSPLHLVTLIGFILVPAQKRVVFEAAVALALSVFIGAFLHVMVPWAMGKEFVQDIVRNVTEGTMGESVNETLARELNGTDEL